MPCCSARLQVTGTVPFTLDVVFESGSAAGRPGSLVGDRYTALLAEKEQQFDLRFEQTFQVMV